MPSLRELIIVRDAVEGLTLSITTYLDRDCTAFSLCCGLLPSMPVNQNRGISLKQVTFDVEEFVFLILHMLLTDSLQQERANSSR